MTCYSMNFILKHLFRSTRQKNNNNEITKQKINNIQKLNKMFTRKGKMQLKRKQKVRRFSIKCTQQKVVLI